MHGFWDKLWYLWDYDACATGNSKYPYVEGAWQIRQVIQYVRGCIGLSVQPFPIIRRWSCMNDCIVRGDIFYANLNYGIGSEQSGYRPVLIIQNNIGNRFSPTVIVAAITGKIHYKTRMPTHCLLDSSQKLYTPSMVLLEQIITIDKSRLKKYIGRMNKEEILHINKALSISVGLENLSL